MKKSFWIFWVFYFGRLVASTLETESYAFVDLELTGEERDAIAQLKVDGLQEKLQAQYDRFGGLMGWKGSLFGFLKSLEVIQRALLSKRRE